MSNFDDNPFGEPAVDNPFAVSVIATILLGFLFHSHTFCVHVFRSSTNLH